jgi:hypothetical protein
MKRHISGILVFLIISSTTITAFYFVRILARELEPGSVPPLETVTCDQASSGNAAVITFAQYDSQIEQLTVRMRMPETRELLEADKLYSSIVVTDGTSPHQFAFRSVHPVGSRISRREVEVRYSLRLPQPGGIAKTSNFLVAGQFATTNSHLNALRPPGFGGAMPVVYVH